MVKSILKRQENQRKEWNSTRDGVLPTPKQNKTKESGNKQKNKTKQNTSIKYMISLGNFSCMQLV